MASFEVFGKFELKTDGVALDHIAFSLKQHLSSHYYANKINYTQDGLHIRGNLSDIFEQAVTDAVVKLKIEQKQFTYVVTGTSSLGKWAWFWFIIGFFTGFGMVFFGIMLIEYIICRDYPKHYFEEAFKAIQFEFG